MFALNRDILDLNPILFAGIFLIITPGIVELV